MKQVIRVPATDIEVDEAARKMLRLLARGERPEPMLRRLLLDALENEHRGDHPHNPDALVSDAARSATEWIDIEQILVATDPLDLQEIEGWLERMVGEDDPRMKKLGEVKAALSLD